jgi:hypothetical protein
MDTRDATRHDESRLTLENALLHLNASLAEICFDALCHFVVHSLQTDVNRRVRYEQNDQR